MNIKGAQSKSIYPSVVPAQMDWARLAAYIDGEGSILISERNTAGRNNWGSYVRVVIANTDPRLPEWLRATFGGVIAFSPRRDKEIHRYAMKWHVSCKQAEWVLRNCYEFLILKQDQADVALAYIATIGGPGKRLTLEKLTARKQMREKIHELRWKRHSLEEITKMRDRTPTPEGVM